MMRKLIGLFFIVCLTASVHGQWSTLGNSIYTSSNEIQFNYSNNPTSTIWLNKNNQGPGTRGHYYIKAFDYWGAYLHFVGTGDQDNERLNVTFDGNVGLGTTNPTKKLHIQGSPWTGIKIQDITTNGGRGVKNEYLDGNDDGWEMYFGGHYAGQPLRFRSIDKGITGVDVLSLLENGQVGIGTIQPDSWSAKLVVNNTDDYSKIIQLGAEGPTTWFMGIGNNSGGYFHIGENNNKRFVINKINGNIGIGTANPNEKLEVNGAIRVLNQGTGYKRGILLFTNSLVSGDNTGIDFCTSNNTDYIGAKIEAERVSGGYSNLNFKTLKSGETTNNPSSSLYIKWSGNVGIGTTNPTEKLSVDGTILAKEIKVSTDGAGWPDFVFSDDYTLKSLTEVENYIKTHKHLPDIPSAEAMEKQGVNLAEMNKLLLQKVEELTLYTIEKDKEVKELKEAKIKETEDRKKLEERLAKIEALLMK